MYDGRWVSGGRGTARRLGFEFAFPSGAAGADATVEKKGGCSSDGDS
jgi:hypothetical protein